MFVDRFNWFMDDLSWIKVIRSLQLLIKERENSTSAFLGRIWHTLIDLKMQLELCFTCICNVWTCVLCIRRIVRKNVGKLDSLEFVFELSPFIWLIFWLIVLWRNCSRIINILGERLLFSMESSLGTIV